VGSARQHHATKVPQAILTEAQHARISELENQIKSGCILPVKKQILTAYQLFENKQFNEVKQRMPHLSKREIAEHLNVKWSHKLSKEERAEFEKLAEQSHQDHFHKVEEEQERINKLREEIHKIKFCSDNQAVKPTGKLKFLTAYRFYRREEVPIVKKMYPETEGKERQALVRKRW